MNMFDVAVVGGGPAGAAAALSLASVGRSVILLDRAKTNGCGLGETLVPEVCSTLSQLGVWDRFLADGPRPTHGIWSAWSEPRLVARDFIANPYGPAWRIDRDRFDRMLRSASEHAGARVEVGFKRVDVKRSAHGWSIAARRGTQVLSIDSRFVVDATGRAASLARASGVRWRAYDRLIAMIGVMEPSGTFVAADDVLLIEPVSSGWWYSSVLPGGELVAVFLTDADLMSVRLRNAIECWGDALATCEFTNTRAAGFTRRAFHIRSAGSGCLDHAAGPGWIAVGDAASAFDPLSGIGIAKGLRSAILAAHTVDQALAGRDRALETYADHNRREFEAAQRIGSRYYGAERRWPESPFWGRRHL